MQRESQHWQRGTVHRLPIAEADHAIADAIFDVEVPQCGGLDVHFLFNRELNAPLLETKEAPTLEDPGFQQVATDPWHDLEAAVVLPVEAAPIY